MSVWLDRGLRLVGEVLPAVLLAVVLVVVTANVVARSILSLPFYAAHDIALIAFAGTVWFGLVGAAVTGQLFGVAFFVGLLPRRLQRPARVAAQLLVIAIAIAVIDAARAQIATSRFSTFLTLGWPKWIVSAGLLASMVLVALVAARAIFAELAPVRAPQGDDRA